MTNIATNLSPCEQYATSPGWPQLAKILRDRLEWLHHSLSCNLLPAAEAAVQFSNILADLLVEYGLINSQHCSGRHRPRCTEKSLENLSVMKNVLRKNMHSDSGNFVILVQAHNKVLKCYHRQVNSREMCRQEREFRSNPWKYVNKRLQPSNSPDPSFDCCTATSYFILTGQ